MARIKVSFIRKVLKQVNTGEISFSRMVELINEEAERNEIIEDKQCCSEAI